MAVEKACHLEWESLSLAALPLNSCVTLDKSQKQPRASVSHMKVEGLNQTQAGIPSMFDSKSFKRNWWWSIFYTVTVSLEQFLLIILPQEI